MPKQDLTTVVNSLDSELASFPLGGRSRLLLTDTLTIFERRTRYMNWRAGLMAIFFLSLGRITHHLLTHTVIDALPEEAATAIAAAVGLVIVFWLERRLARQPLPSEGSSDCRKVEQ